MSARTKLVNELRRYINGPYDQRGADKVVAALDAYLDAREQARALPPPAAVAPSAPPEETNG